MHLPSQALADAIAAELAALQGKKYNPEAAPMHRLACFALDEITPNRKHHEAQMLDLLDGDTLFYFAPEPPQLVAQQEACWKPLIAYAAAELGCHFIHTHGLTAISQPPEAHQAIRQAMESMDSFKLAVWHQAALLTSSILTGFAMATGRITAHQAMEAAYSEDIYQLERWGDDLLARRRLERIEGELTQIERFLVLQTAQYSS